MAGDNGAALVQQLLNVARPAGAESRECAVNDVVIGIQDLLTRLIGENIVLKTSLAPDLGAVAMEPAQVQQILLNLVLNARDAMPDGGRITVATRNCSLTADSLTETARWVELRVTDTGCGMAADTLDHAFDPFFTTKKPGRSSGLGLATARRLAAVAGWKHHRGKRTGKGHTDFPAPAASRNPWSNQSRNSRGDFMTTAALSASLPVQMEGANFLNLLIVDDERAIREVCREVAQSLGFNTAVADSAEHAYRLLDTHNIDVVLLDLKLPGVGGLEALHQIGERKPDAVVVVVTGYGTVQSAVQAMKNGAYDYVTKPFSMDELKLLLERVSGHLKLKTENRTLREKIKSKLGFGSIVGRAPEMEKLYRMIGKAAHSSHPVLILGESGTGKEMVARSIHFSGPFHDKPFIPVDCGSLVPTLIESELFGYVKGAFTGAVQSRDGLLAIAEGGTVFLDEVGELPVDLQAKLLRAIQEREIRPVGSTKRITINVRILAATNRDLEQAVAQGTFRRDLYFRLNVLSLKIPPLRDRRQDIPLLTGYFMERLSRSAGHERTLSDEAMKALLAYDWPGNVREFENCLERACAFTSGPVIQVGDLPSAIHGVPATPSTAGNGKAHIVPMAELEKQTILSTIAQLNGDKLLAARMLGIGKTTLYRKLKEYVAQD